LSLRKGFGCYSRVGRYCGAALLPVLVAAVSLSVVGGASATTAPDVVNTVRVVLTPTAVEIPRDQFVLANGITRYPRGALIVFNLFNETTKPLSVVLKVAEAGSVVHLQFLKLRNLLSAGKPIPPGTSRRFRVSFSFRGSFVLESLVGGKVAGRAPIIIF
jgi:hypothetical protein